MKKPVIELKNISKSFNNIPLLKKVNLTIEEGDSLTIVGPGGMGKSVLLKIIALIIPPDSGDIFYYGKDARHFSQQEINDLRHQTGMLFQNYALFDSLNIRENVGFFLDYHTEISNEEISKTVAENLRKVNLKDIEHLKPAQLSGGMKKRVGIARAITHKPKIIFLDEPTAGLDPITTNSISRMINKLHDELSITQVNITNDMACANTLSNKLAMLYNGVIHKVGFKDEMLDCNDQLVQQFLQGKRQGPINIHDKIDF